MMKPRTNSGFIRCRFGEIDLSPSKPFRVRDDHLDSTVPVRLFPDKIDGAGLVVAFYGVDTEVLRAQWPPSYGSYNQTYGHLTPGSPIVSGHSSAGLTNATSGSRASRSPLPRTIGFSAGHNLAPHCRRPVAAPIRLTWRFDDQADSARHRPHRRPLSRLC